MIAFTLQLVFERRTSHPSACYAVDQRSADCWWFLWVCRPWGTLIFILLMLVWKSTVSITAKFSSSKNSCPTSKNSRITSPSNKMGHLLTVQRRQSVCSITIHQTSSRHHFGLQIVQTSTRSITKYGCPSAASLQQENPNCGWVETAYH